jgi:hypothetical protein
MVLLDPAAQSRARLIGNVGDVVHPFIMQDRQHHAEQRGHGAFRAEHQRDKPGGYGEIGHQKPDRQEQ